VCVIAFLAVCSSIIKMIFIYVVSLGISVSLVEDRDMVSERHQREAMLLWICSLA